jgi:hypothetical protein
MGTKDGKTSDRCCSVSIGLLSPFLPQKRVKDGSRLRDWKGKQPAKSAERKLLICKGLFTLIQTTI